VARQLGEQADLAQAVLQHRIRRHQHRFRGGVDEERDGEPVRAGLLRVHDLVRGGLDHAVSVELEHVAGVEDQRAGRIDGVHPHTLAGLDLQSGHRRGHHERTQVDVFVSAGAFHLLVAIQRRVVDRPQQVAAVLDPAAKEIPIPAHTQRDRLEDHLGTLLERRDESEHRLAELGHFLREDVVHAAVGIVAVPEGHQVALDRPDRDLPTRRGVAPLMAVSGEFVGQPLLFGHHRHEDLLHGHESLSDQVIRHDVSGHREEPDVLQSLDDRERDLVVVGLITLTKPFHVDHRNSLRFHSLPHRCGIFHRVVGS